MARTNLHIMEFQTAPEMTSAQEMRLRSFMKWFSTQALGRHVHCKVPPKEMSRTPTLDCGALNA